MRSPRSGAVTLVCPSPPPYAGRRADRSRDCIARRVRVVLPALVYAKAPEEQAAVADLELIDRTIRSPDERPPIRGPVASGFLRREQRSPGARCC